jgi:hypothetical protein
MSEIYDGSIEVSFGYGPTDLDDLKAQVQEFLPVDSSIDDFMRTIEGPMILGLTNAAIWLANKAAWDAPILTGRLRASGSAWVNSRRVYITGGGTHPDQLDTGPMTAIIIFNTPYAFIQDTEISFLHPRGGRSGYLTANFIENHQIIEKIMFTPVQRVIEHMQKQ